MIDDRRVGKNKIMIKNMSKSKSMNKSRSKNKNKNKIKNKNQILEPTCMGTCPNSFFFVFFVDAKDFSQTLVILSSMFNLPIFKYATAH